MAVLKYLEIKIGNSAHSIIEKLKSVTDGRMFNTLTGKEIILREKMSDEVQELLKKIYSPH